MSVQFQYNSDYPTLPAKAPVEFPPVQPKSCARITTRVFHPSRNETSTVQNVLVRTNVTVPMRTASSAVMMDADDGPDGMRSGNNNAGSTNGIDDNSSDAYSSSSSSSEETDYADDDDDDDDDDIAMTDEGNTHHSRTTAGAAGAGPSRQTEERAYWMQRTLREAIYGRVLFGIVLKKNAATGVWRVTEEQCAIKEMSWQHIRKERGRLAEDPIKEVSAMEYIRQWRKAEQRQRQATGMATSSSSMSTTVATANTTARQSSSSSSSTSSIRMTPLQEQNQQQEAGRSRIPLQDNPNLALTPLGDDDDDDVEDPFDAMADTNIMMPMDLLSDDTYLYSIMPFCDGGELFERLDLNERFTEDEARHWMRQILNVRAHKDWSRSIDATLPVTAAAVSNDLCTTPQHVLPSQHVLHYSPWKPSCNSLYGHTLFLLPKHTYTHAYTHTGTRTHATSRSLSQRHEFRKPAGPSERVSDYRYGNVFAGSLRSGYWCPFLVDGVYEPFQR